MTKIALVFEELVGSSYRTTLSGRCFRSSPFVDYIATASEYSDLFEFFTLDDVKHHSSSNDRIYIFPIGVNMFFDLTIQSMALSNTAEGIRLKQLLKNIREIRGDIYLMIDMSWECGKSHYVDSIPILAEALDFPVYRMVYIANNPITHKLSGLPARFGYHVAGAWFFEFYTHVVHKHLFARIDRPNTDENDQAARRIALSLNRRVRPHRVLLAAYLKSKDYINEIFFSFGGKAANDIDNYHIRNEAINRARQMAERFQNAEFLGQQCVDYIIDKEPFEIDVEFKSIAQDSSDFNKNLLSTSAHMEECYKNSFFSIVTETDFGSSDEDFLLTEKTFKPLLLKHPVVVFSGPGALRELQELGYLTYDPIIPESYDQIFDPNLRFASIAESIDLVFDKIRHMPDEFMAQCLPIIEHNKKNFIEGTPTRARAFIASLVHDLRRLPTSGHRSSSLLESKLLQTNRFSFSEFSGVVFLEGFYQYELAHAGRWCSAQGRLSIWLGRGDWDITLFLRINNEAMAPDIYLGGKRLPCRYAKHNDRIAVSFIMRELSDFAMLQFNSKSTFVPAEIDKNAESHRRLGFWLFDEFLLERVLD